MRTKTGYLREDSSLAERYRAEQGRIDRAAAVQAALERELRARGMHEAEWGCDDERDEAIGELVDDAVASLGLDDGQWYDFLRECADEAASPAP
jgi:hypothetical protein